MLTHRVHLKLVIKAHARRWEGLYHSLDTFFEYLYLMVNKTANSAKTTLQSKVNCKNNLIVHFDNAEQIF